MAHGLKTRKRMRCLTVAMVTALGTLAAGSLNLAWASAPTGGWKQLNTPGRNNQWSELDAIACPYTTLCWAVGHDFNGVHAQNRIEQWDGSAWKLVPVPSVPGVDNYLFEIRCTYSHCLAVGDTSYIGRPPADFAPQLLVLEWNGGNWQISAAPKLPPGSRDFTKLSCVSAADCWMAENPGKYQGPPRFQHWNGAGWTEYPGAGFPSGAFININQLACAATNVCWLLGDDEIDGTRQLFTERWDGSGWTLSQEHYGTIKCQRPVFCTASAWVQGDPALQLWNGSAWTTLPRLPAGTTAIATATCVDQTKCLILGTSKRYDSTAGILSNGTWTMMPAPGFGPVACASGETCFAVGTQPTQNELVRARIDEYSTAFPAPTPSPTPAPATINGWTTTDGPVAPDGGRTGALAAITCASSGDCWALSNSPESGQIIHLHNGAWAFDRIPALLQTGGQAVGGVICAASGSVCSYAGGPNLATARLRGISCTGPSSCWAVGDYTMDHYTYSTTQALTWRFSGNAWLDVSTPADPVTLTSVSCPGANDCWAGGLEEAGQPPHQQAVIGHYDGNSWSFTAGARDAQFTGVACTSTVNCWMAGTRWDQPANPPAAPPCPATASCGWPPAWQDAILEHYDGTRWAPAPLAEKPFAGVLTSVTCTSATACWAAGWRYGGKDQYGFPASPRKAWILAFNGKTWTETAVPGTGSQNSDTLLSIACANSQSCWAVGGTTSSGRVQATNALAEEFDGRRWSIVLPAGRSSISTYDASGVACIDAGNCWAALSPENGKTPSLTLAHYSAGDVATPGPAKPIPMAILLAMAVIVMTVAVPVIIRRRSR